MKVNKRSVTKLQFTFPCKIYCPILNFFFASIISNIVILICFFFFEHAVELKEQVLYTFTTTMAAIVGCELVKKKGKLVMKLKIDRVAGNLVIYCLKTRAVTLSNTQRIFEF